MLPFLQLGPPCPFPYHPPLVSPTEDTAMLMKYRLFTPGPTSVPEATLLELARPVHHHRTAEFRAMFNELQSLLQYVYQTKNTVYTITGSGTAAFEAG